LVGPHPKVRKILLLSYEKEAKRLLFSAGAAFVFRVSRKRPAPAGNKSLFASFS
jgi:hypothetical protein